MKNSVPTLLFTRLLQCNMSSYWFISVCCTGNKLNEINKKLSGDVHNLTEMNAVSKLTETLCAMNKQLSFRRKELVSELNYIYPITEVRNNNNYRHRFFRRAIYFSTFLKKWKLNWKIPEYIICGNSPVSIYCVTLWDEKRKCLQKTRFNWGKNHSAVLDL